MPETILEIVGFAGSLRSGSYNRTLLAAAADLMPEGANLTQLVLDGIPPYNEDIDNDEDRPASVERFKSAIASADGVLIVTPEYSHGVPGLLKNALDWASRPRETQPMSRRPVALMGASPGVTGTARAQEQLKLAVMAMGAQVYPAPTVAVGGAKDKLADGRITDERTEKFTKRYLSGFAEWIQAIPRPS